MTSLSRDPRFEPVLLRPDADDEDLARELQLALSRSRFLKDAELSLAEHETPATAARFEANLQKLVEGYAIPSRKTLLRGLSTCYATLEDQTIMLEPTRKYRLEGSTGLGRESLVSVRVDSPAEEIGAALRLALSRCQV